MIFVDQAMSAMNRRRFLQAAALATGGVAFGGVLRAATVPGVEIQALPYVTADERQSHPDLWVMEVNFKPLRLIRVELPDPKTGESRAQWVWYMVYRAINRPIERRKADETDVPDTTIDRPEHLFVPEFLLITDDNNVQKRYYDRVMPVAQAAIEKRERHRYKNSVEIVGPVPEVVPFDESADNALYGVATWRGIDKTADRFKIFMTGFSNAYQIKDVDGQEVILRKTLVQEFTRFGDEFDLDETEFRAVGNPQWIYR